MKLPGVSRDSNDTHALFARPATTVQLADSFSALVLLEDTTCVLTVVPVCARKRVVQHAVVARSDTVEPTVTAGPLVSEVVAYLTATMLAWTEFSVASDG
jgi:hypothetical protein